MILCHADITSKNPKKVKLYIKNYKNVIKKAIEVEERDRLRSFKSPIDGNEIMKLFNLEPGPIIGKIKKSIENAILDGVIANEYSAALKFINDKKNDLFN
jgi:tRNA nucleotidyltransferase/poly(A) polymerase